MDYESDDNRAVALEVELRHFELKKQELLLHHEGKYALIVGEELLGVFDRQDEAYRAGVAQKGNVPMLIKRILKVEATESVPAMVLGLIAASL